jgi:curved DNA-binding protein CbpA
VARDAYRTLGVSPYADAATISAAYRRLARELHPDVNHAPDANRRMKELNHAYEVLREPGRRAAYDRDRLARALADHDWSPEPTPSYRSDRWRDAYADAQRAQARSEAAGRASSAEGAGNARTRTDPHAAADGGQDGAASDPDRTGAPWSSHAGRAPGESGAGSASGSAHRRQRTESGQAWQWYADPRSAREWRWGFGSTGETSWTASESPSAGEPQRWWPASRPYAYGSARYRQQEPWRYVARLVGTVILILGLTAHLWAHAAAPIQSRPSAPAPATGAATEPGRNASAPSGFAPAVNPAMQGALPNPDRKLESDPPRSGHDPMAARPRG